MLDLPITPLLVKARLGCMQTYHREGTYHRQLLEKIESAEWHDDLGCLIEQALIYVNTLPMEP
jgi:hypothetical protein